MFENIGGKIKTLAFIALVIGVVLSLVCGIALREDGGIVFAIGGTFFVVIGSFALYGLGEIVEKVTEIAENTRKDDISSEE